MTKLAGLASAIVGMIGMFTNHEVAGAIWIVNSTLLMILDRLEK